MTPGPVRRVWTLLAAWIVCAHGAAAHEFWIAPSGYQAMPGTTVELSAVAGTGFRGERKPWSPDHAVRFTLRTARSIDIGRAASPGDMTWTRFAPTDAGGAMVAFESDFLPIELPAAQFNLYLKAEGLDRVLTARNGSLVPGRERYRRCAKAWLAGREAARATDSVGLPLELVPAATPGAAPELSIRVLWGGRPLAGALVKAWRTTLSPEGLPRPAFDRDSVQVAWQGRSDADGRVTIPVRDGGEWLVSTVHMERCPDLRQADWESTWASLSFARVGGEAATDGSPRVAAAPGASPRSGTAAGR